MNSLYSESNRATYCPEDNKLRLYVGRVPRAEYEALRAGGCWYQRHTAESTASAARITGTPAPEPFTPDFTDLAYEDACALACGLA